MTDPIADMLTRIKNALMAGHREVVMPHSKMKHRIADILVSEGYLESVKVVDGTPGSHLEMKLKYVGKLPAVNGVRRLSKPGRRLYSPVKRIPRTLGGYGITIVSTSKGLMTGKEARQQNVGGELLCQVW